MFCLRAPARVPGSHMFECVLVCVGVCASEGFPLLWHSFSAALRLEDGAGY